jgi:glutamate dehydrogenase (NADP+)
MLENVLKEHSLQLENKSVCISGSGNVALYAAQKSIELDAKVLTLSDSDGVLYFKNGMSKEDLDQIKIDKLQNRKRLSEFKGNGDFEYKDSQNPWSIKAQIAIPCATQNEISSEDASNITRNKYEVVVEGANMPLTKDATDIIMDSKVIYVPGKIANAGGVAISNLERSQNAQLVQWSFSEVDDKLKSIMKSIHENAVTHIDKIDGKYNYKKGANIYGFKKIADAIVAYGLV